MSIIVEKPIGSRSAETVDRRLCGRYRLYICSVLSMGMKYDLRARHAANDSSVASVSAQITNAAPS